MNDQKRALVVGMARSGIWAAKLLISAGYAVRINDLKTEAEFEGALDELRLANIEWRLGEKAEDALTGIDLVVISPGIPIDHAVVKVAREKGIELIGEIELAYRYAKGKLIAITGTNGKTTTTSLTGEIFQNAGRQTYVVGNIGFPYTAIAEQTKSDDVVVCEVSSFQLESIDAFHPSIAAILNITEDHMNRHFTMRRYSELKARVFENQGTDDFLVLNYDDSQVKAMAEDAKAKVLWFSRVGAPPYGAFVRDNQIVFGTEREHRAVCPTGEVGIPGPANLENALAATCIAMAADVPPPVIRHTLRTFKGVEHRLEFVRELDGVRFVNDSKGTNVDSTLKAIASMDRPTVIILGGYDKKVDMTALCEALTCSEITDAVLIGETAAILEKGLLEAGFRRFVHAGYDFRLAIEKACALSVPGGNILLSPACASFDMFGDYEQRGETFKRIVNELERVNR